MANFIVVPDHARLINLDTVTTIWMRDGFTCIEFVNSPDDFLRLKLSQEQYAKLIAKVFS